MIHRGRAHAPRAQDGAGLGQARVWERSLGRLAGIGLLGAWLFWPHWGISSEPLALERVHWLNAPAVPQGAQGTPPEPDLPACLRIRRATQDSSLFTLYVSVLDRQGEPVPGLRSTDFRLFVDGRTEPLTEVALMTDKTTEHLAVVIALGLSDSARHTQMVLDAFSSAFVAELNETKPDLCALLTCRGRIAVPRLFSADPLLLKAALSRIHFSGEGLLLNAAITAARTLIYQNDTVGYGVVVMAFDEADSLVSLPLDTKSEPDPLFEGPSIYALGVDLPPESDLERLAALSRHTGGESFLAAGDSLALRSAAGRIIRILQGQYLVSVREPQASQLRLEYVGNQVLSDAIDLPAARRIPLPEGSPGLLHPGLVRKSLWVGLALLVVILALHWRNRV